MKNTNQVLPTLNGVTLYMPEGNHPRELYEIHTNGRIIYAAGWAEALMTVAYEAAMMSEVGWRRALGAYVRAVNRLADQVAREVYQARMAAEACR